MDNLNVEPTHERLPNVNKDSGNCEGSISFYDDGRIKELVFPNGYRLSFSDANEAESTCLKGFNLGQVFCG